MAVVVTAALLCVFNVVMWIAFLVHFKKLFSTDEILTKAREELHSVLLEINANTDRNITLVAEARRSLKEEAAAVESHLKEATQEAERRLAALEKGLAQSDGKRALTEQLEAASPKPERKKTAQPRAKRLHALPPEQKYMQEQLRGPLFTTTPPDSPEQPETQPDSGVPVIVRAPDPITVQKDYKVQVRELAAQGMTVDEIAAALGRSTQEIKFTLEFS